MNKQELIKHFEDLPYVSITQMGKKSFIDLIEQLDEPQKPVVPQFVADWITNVKRNGFKFRNSSRFHEEIVSSDDVYRVMYYILKESIAGGTIRIWVNANRDAFARAWLDGYEVEKEKRYLVKLKGVYHGDLGYAENFNGYSFYNKDRNLSGIKYEHTRKQLEDAGFGWVLDCPGIELEEVTE